MLASVIQSGSRLEVKSRTEFVENVAGFILVRDTPYLKLYLKGTKKVHPRKFHLSIWGQIQHELVRFSAREEKQKMLLCCFVVLLH